MSPQRKVLMILDRAWQTVNEFGKSNDTIHVMGNETKS